MNWLRNYICRSCRKVVIAERIPRDGVCWSCHWDDIGGALVFVVVALLALSL